MSPRARLLPDRALETELLAGTDLVAGMDEVGRGALAGPVSVGLAVVSRSTPAQMPTGLADSKQLTARRRQALVAPVRQWVVDWAVAHAWPQEIDGLGIMGALRLAGLRALEEVGRRGHRPGAIILDGTANWLAPPSADLLEGLEPAPAHAPQAAAPGVPRAGRDDGGDAGGALPPVRMEVKADARCAVVAAASVLAKVERDGLMEELADPGYGWASNKGYASPAHIRALARLGAGEQHRRSWRLPGLDGPSR
ncbi:ribonuclease HII [Actinomyces bowdenii]|uniref:Ribonuclease n=1 Tax=Actinomyces bowdenii TaxID=131109 RepID=A0A853EM09_9ACTO|nr:ribonuclease HII [Actinomyces bowdenii]MBF0698021.1 ribonuclease HII [Actinomyces bowdenii]NYS70194.1 ribonuclease HII [Actinomyces bowdenii]